MHYPGFYYNVISPLMSSTIGSVVLCFLLSNIIITMFKGCAPERSKNSNENATQLDGSTSHATKLRLYLSNISSFRMSV